MKSQVSASRLITIHTLANGDKVSNPVHNMSLAHFRPNGDIPRSHMRCLSKRHNKMRNLGQFTVTHGKHD